MSTRPGSVAIVGLACRYPGAASPQALWKGILTRKASFREVPPERWNHTAFLVQGRSRDTFSTFSRKAAFLKDWDSFAGPYFGIAPRRAECMDPQQRLMLELAREGLQDAGLEMRPWDRRRSAVFLGASVSEYNHMVTAPIRARLLAAGRYGSELGSDQAAAAVSRVAGGRSYTLPGCLLSMCATNIAQFYDLGGPAFTIDSACASSLTSVVQAVHYLRALPPRKEGPAPVALAGGVYMILAPDCMIGFAKIGAIASEECRPFDADSSGFLLGEGAGLVVLKLLQDALADGDSIYAVIRGCAWNSDGYGESAMTPGRQGQRELLALGLADAELELADLGYLECHGTATRVGDRVELESLAQALEPGHSRPCLGSVKGNLGHTMSAAGVAGLLRATLSVHHATLPPQANWSCWHPDLEQAARSFEMLTEPRPWGAALRRAGVSAFGFGGTNAFVILESVPATSKSPSERPLFFWLGAESDDLLASYARLLESALDQGESLHDLAYTLAVRRPGPRVAVVRAGHVEELREQLRRLCVGLESSPENFGKLEAGVWAGPAEVSDYRALSETLEGAELPRSGRLLRISASPVHREKYHVVTPEAGRPLPPPVPFVLSLESCPALRDHQIRNRSFLPLAGAIAWMMAALELKPPLALRDLRVERGLLVKDSAQCEVRLESGRIRLWERRKTGRESLAFEASLANEPGDPPVLPACGREPSVAVDLTNFYSRSFHGPSLQGIQGVLELSETFGRARLGPGQPEDWNLPAESWSVDPLALDSGLQLALLWSLHFHGRWLVPTKVAEFALLEAFPRSACEARIALRSFSPEGVVGDLHFLSRGRLIAWFDGLQARWLEL